MIYKDKNYEKEVDFIENIFGESKPKKILEVGCGTGNYTKILLERGYEVTAVDISEDMLEIARRKCDCEFIKGDVRDIALNEKFDACIAMFAVMGYITENSDLVKALNKWNNMFDEINEKHSVRFYFPQEIKHYLEEAGFEVLKICPFLDLNGGANENVWNMCVIARAVGGER